MELLHMLLSIFLVTFLHSDAALCQTLQAAAKSSHLKRRGLDLEPRFEGNRLFYTDSLVSAAGRVPTTAQVSLKPKLPTLILEDVDEHFHSISCDGSTIRMVFHSIEQLDHARATWSKHDEFIVVVSETTCGRTGQHEPIIVSGGQYSSDDITATFAAKRQHFKHCTHSMDIEVGSQFFDSVHRSNLFRRFPLPQQSSSSVATPSVSDFPTFTFPSSVISQSPTATSVTGDVSFSYKNEMILPPSQQIASALVGQSPVSGITVECVDCTLTGKLELSTANFTVVPDDDMETVTNFFESGIIEFAARGLSATMDFKFSVTPGFTALSLEPALPNIPITPFQIPGVAAVGPIFEPTFPMGIKFHSTLDLEAGFKLSVPDGSTVTLDVADPGGSRTKGFSASAFSALPLDASAPDISLEFYAAFRPKLVLGVSAAPLPNEVRITGGVGAFLDLPYLNATVAAVSAVDDHCNPGGAIDGLVNFIPSATFDAGVLWQLGAHFDGFNVDREGDYPLVGTTLPLPTACYSFDQAKGGLVGANPDVPSAGSADLEGKGDRPGKGAALIAVAGVLFGMAAVLH